MNALMDLLASVDAAEMARYIGMDTDPWQSEVLRSHHSRILLNCHRQAGKSTVSSVLATHAAVYEPGALVLLVSKAQRQSVEIFRKCMAAYESLGRPIVVDTETALSLRLENGSRIISLPGTASTVRGYSGVRLVVIDEAAYTDDDLLDALWPMLAVSKGRIVALTTPHGKRGWFWQMWSTGGESWLRVEQPVTKCPPGRIDPDFLAEFRRSRGERSFAQEYLCQFVETTDQAFGEDAINAAFDRDIEPLRFDAPEPDLDLDGPTT